MIVGIIYLLIRIQLFVHFWDEASGFQYVKSVLLRDMHGLYRMPRSL